MLKLFKYKKKKMKIERVLAFQRGALKLENFQNKSTLWKLRHKRGFRLACVDHFIGFTKAETYASTNQLEYKIMR